jgi:hypothetical protein
MLGMERKANAALLGLALLDLVKIRSRVSMAAYSVWLHSDESADGGEPDERLVGRAVPPFQRKASEL